MKTARKILLMAWFLAAVAMTLVAQTSPFGDDAVKLDGIERLDPAATRPADPAEAMTGWVRADMVTRSGNVITLAKDAVNIRKGPGTSYDPITTGSRGASYPLLGERDGWYAVSLAAVPPAPANKKLGYIRKDMGALRGNLVVVTVDTVNVRGGPSTNFQVIKRADFGAVFPFEREENGWYVFGLGEPPFSGEPSNAAAIAAAQQRFQAAYTAYTQAVLKSGRTSAAAQGALAAFRQTYLDYKLLARNSQVMRDVRAGRATVGKVVVSKADFTATVYVNGQVARIYPIAYGANADGLNKKAQGDSRTPEGAFKIVGKAVNPAYQPLKIPGGAPNNPFGTRWMGLNTWGGSIGLHGTSNPLSIGTRASHGCVRMFTPDAEELFELVRVGTPVEIRAVKEQ